MRCPPIDILVGFVYIEGAGVTPRPSVCYQFSNLRIAAVIRPEIVPARIVSAKTCNLLGCAILLARAVGLCRRRFFLPISTTPFLLNCLYYSLFRVHNQVAICTKKGAVICLKYALYRVHIK